MKNERERMEANFLRKKINRERHVYEFNPTDMLVPGVHFSVQINAMFAGFVYLLQTVLANFDDALCICKYLPMYHSHV